MAPASLLSVTPEEYLEFDRKSAFRNEFVWGEIVPMVDATPWHSLITANAIAVLHNHLPTGPCRLFGSTLRVCIDPRAAYAYPDATVICGELEYLDDKKDTVTNPKMVVEVLSPSTRDYDLGGKARAYTEIPSLSELLLIDQKRVLIEHWWRLPNTHWEVARITDVNARIRLESFGCEFPVCAVYAGVELVSLPV